MDIKYKTETIGEKVYIDDIDINLENTLFSGQAFRWKHDGKGFFGVCFGEAIRVEKQGNRMMIENCNAEFFENKMAHYFDLCKDYSEITKGFEFDEILNASFEFAPGIRVLNQEPFETLISFIISANNNIKRIRLIIENISKNFGQKKEYNGQEFFSFPSVEELSKATEADLAACGAGYRAPYIVDTVSKLADGFDLEAIGNMPYLEARKKLCELKGVGKKVADCVLLYSMGFTNAFPLDVWIKRVVHNIYGFESEKDEEILGFVEDTFGEHAGIAQQYLFYYVKQNKLGIK